MLYSLLPFSHSAPLLVTGYALFTNRRSRWRDAMATRYSIILSTLCLLCTACTLQQDLALVREDLDRVRQEMATIATHMQHQEAWATQTQDQLAQMRDHLDQLDPLRARLTRLEAAAAVPVRKGKGVPKPQTPMDLISSAQKEAQVLPSPTCYFGQSGECTYTWMPGRIYAVYITWNHQTLIALPPGETLVIGLNLEEKSFDVINKLVGSEPLAYSVVSVRPLIEKGTAEANIVSQSGRRYLFLFVIGDKGMRGINFETPAMHPEAPEKKLILPRPPA
jgi:hypothetical protein